MSSAISLTGEVYAALEELGISPDQSRVEAALQAATEALTDAEPLPVQDGVRVRAPVQHARRSQWQEERGPRGARRWRNVQTGEVSYEPPGQQQTPQGAVPQQQPAAAAGVPRTGTHPGAAHGSAVRIRATKERAFRGEPVPVKTKLTKQETGRIGEAVAIAWLRAQGATDARPMNSERTNFAVDLIEDHAPTEVKAGLASNAKDAQKWRLTFSQESKTEKALYAKMTGEEKARWNADKQRRIHERKEAVIQMLEKQTGKKVRPQTLTLIINPDTRTADVYLFPEWRDILRWNSPEARAAYKGSVVYDAAD